MTSRTWEALLSVQRTREHTDQSSFRTSRAEFENDYTRVAFCPAFRSLQDKTQVFALDDSDFVRTRLTHSLETSAIGRSIGAIVEERLAPPLEEDCFGLRGKISAILATVGLAHDLGNPPFGHFGERVIGEFFADYFRKYRPGLTKQQRADLENFEGNAQSLRMLTRLQYMIDKEGLNLTYGTLASMVKYPHPSTQRLPDGEEASRHKFGYFWAEQGAFEKIRETTGLGETRHPIAFLLEAADDIAYSAADIEDGVKKGVLDIEAIRGAIGELEIGTGKTETINEALDEYLHDADKTYEDWPEIAVQRLRVRLQGFMITAVVEEFVKRHTEILNGGYDNEILLTSKACDLRIGLKKLAETHIYNDQRLVTRELLGQRVLSGLLRIFLEAVESDNRTNRRTMEGKLYPLIPPNYRYICENCPSGEPSPYDRFLLVTDFVCGMTDSHALQLYQTLTGIKL